MPRREACNCLGGSYLECGKRRGLRLSQTERQGSESPRNECLNAAVLSYLHRVWRSLPCRNAPRVDLSSAHCPATTRIFAQTPRYQDNQDSAHRSEERRVGKECRSR